MRSLVMPVIVACLLALCYPSDARAALDTDTMATSQDAEVSANLANPSMKETNPPPPSAPKDKDWVATLLNVLAIAFMVWLAQLMFKPGIGPSLSKKPD